MGYILPVPFYQYQDYQERVTRDEQNSYFIQGPYKTILNSTHKEIEDQEDIFKKNEKNDKPSLFIPKQSYQAPQTEKVFSELTGKGRNFSESI